MDDTGIQHGFNIAPAYGPFRTVPNAKNELRQSGIPAQIDRTVFKGKPWEQTQGMTTLRALGWIDEANAPQELFIRFIQADRNEERAVLRETLERAYPYLFRDGELAYLTTKAIDARFVELGVTDDTARKCRTFFLNALRASGYLLPRNLIPRQRTTRVTRSAPNKGETKPKLLPNVNSNNGKTAEQQNSDAQSTLGLGDQLTHGGAGSSGGDNEHDDKDELASRYELVSSYLHHLPKNGRWTTKERERWIKAFESALDFYAEVIDES